MTYAHAATFSDSRPMRRAVLVLLAVVVAAVTLGAALRAPGAPSLAVIVRSTADSLASAERLVVSLGGRIDLQLGIINGFRATVPSAALARLAHAPQIWSITPDAPVHMNAVDPTLGYDTGDNGSPYLVAKAVGATSAWQAGVTGAGVDVAVIDTGVAPLPELKNRVVYGPDLSPESQVDALRYNDTYGHGTHMAGLIAGRDPNLGAGVTATAGNYTGVAPGARVVSVKVATYNGATDVSQVLAAIDWVVQNKKSGGLNIRVLNLSFGTDGTQDYRLDPLAFAAEVAWRNGIVVVAAAGNEGFGNAKLNNPAYDPFVIAVGADDTRGTAGSGNDLVPDFSARGDTRGVDFVAPGRSVISLRVPGSYIDTNFPGGRVGDRFFRGSGTSQAAAVTSGVVALLLQQRPNLTPDQVKYILRQSAAPLPSEESVAKGKGLVAIDRAMSFATPLTGYQQTFEPSTGLGTLEGARGSQKLSDNGIELKGEQDIFGNKFDTSAWAPLSASGSSWTGGAWMGSSWTGSSWTGSSWTGSSWTGSSWTGSSWTGSSWTGSSWTGSSWTGSSWTGSSWTGSSWTGSSWTGSSWTGSSWTGSSWTGSSWTGSSWTGKFWSSAGWGE
ncbi:MAG TPA: S8 family serine peptidase [Candidatus Limnocylindria bacterium]|nr:S8 family serine peptidase [Candidatus Limnocylindria bacterium]